MIEIRRHLHRNPELSNRTIPGFVSMRGIKGRRRDQGEQPLMQGFARAGRAPVQYLIARRSISTTTQNSAIDSDDDSTIAA